MRITFYEIQAFYPNPRLSPILRSGDLFSVGGAAKPIFPPLEARFRPGRGTCSACKTALANLGANVAKLG